MERTYHLNDLVLMTGLTTRTLRNYLTQGLLHGEKADGVWQFTDAELDRFFSDPFVKEALKIKRSSVVFDFLAERSKDDARTCVILDIPASRAQGSRISAFFCERMCDTEDAKFNYGWEKGLCRVILSGAADSVAKIMGAYSAMDFSD